MSAPTHILVLAMAGSTLYKGLVEENFDNVIELHRFLEPAFQFAPLALPFVYSAEEVFPILLRYAILFAVLSVIATNVMKKSNDSTFFGNFWWSTAYIARTYSSNLLAGAALAWIKMRAP